MFQIVQRYSLGLLVGLLAIVIGIGAHALREARETAPDRRIYFYEGADCYFIRARDYRGHWIAGDRLLIENAAGPLVMLPLYEATTQHTLDQIEALRARGVLPGDRP